MSERVFYLPENVTSERGFKSKTGLSGVKPLVTKENESKRVKTRFKADSGNTINNINIKEKPKRGFWSRFFKI